MKLARLALPLLLIAALPAQADQGVSLLSGFTDFTTWSLHGTATAANTTPGNGFTYSDLVLTQVGLGAQAGAGFAPAALALDFNQAFHFDFSFFIPASSGIRGDGLTFTLSDAKGVGNAGSGLGYEALSEHSFAFAVDTFHFDGEPVSPSLQILAGGSVTPLSVTETGLGDAIRDPDYQWLAQLDYAPSGAADHAGVLTGQIWHPNLGSFSVTAPVNFTDLGLVGVPLYYGFTASNGLADDGHIITSAMAVPEPHGWALLLSGLIGLRGIHLRRRRG